MFPTVRITRGLQLQTIDVQMLIDLWFILDDDWGAPAEENDYLPEADTTGTSLTLPRLPRSPERLPSQVNRGVSPSCNRSRRAPEFRQRSPSPQYQPRVNPGEVTSPRERFQDAKEMFRAMEREAIARPVLSRQRDADNHPVHRYVSRCVFPLRATQLIIFSCRRCKRKSRLLEHL